jgi:hypothetical protein
VLIRYVSIEVGRLCAGTCLAQTHVVKEEATAILWSMLTAKDEVHTTLLEWQQLALKMARCP